MHFLKFLSGMQHSLEVKANPSTKVQMPPIQSSCVLQRKHLNLPLNTYVVFTRRITGTSSNVTFIVQPLTHSLSNASTRRKWTDYTWVYHYSLYNNVWYIQVRDATCCPKTSTHSILTLVLGLNEINWLLGCFLFKANITTIHDSEN